MKILDINNKIAFKGLMDIRVCTRDKCYNAVVQTSDEDDKKISSLISEGDVVDFYYATYDDESYKKQLDKTKSIVDLIKNICAEKKLYFPKLDYKFDYPLIKRKDKEITFNIERDYGTEGNPSFTKDYQWKQININLYTRKPEDIKQNITKLIDENKKYPNYNYECSKSVNLITKELSKEKSFEENYLLLLDNEFILLNMNEKLKKELEIDGKNDLPF